MPLPDTWLDQTTLAARRVAERLASADRDQAWDVLATFAAGIPRITSLNERVLLRSILLDVAYGSGEVMHRRLHGGGGDCSFSAAALLDRFWTLPNDELAQQFDRWREALFAELNRIHPPSLASSVGRLVKRDFRKPWTLPGLGRRFHATSSQISRAFHREFGSSVREYHRVARLVAALDILGTEKVEVVASQVGFRSKKNFYRAFARLVRLTPGEFQQLPVERASKIRTTASSLLARPSDHSPHSKDSK